MSSGSLGLKLLLAPMLLGLFLGQSYAKKTTFPNAVCQDYSPLRSLGEGRDSYVLIRGGESVTQIQTWYLVQADCQEKPFILYGYSKWGIYGNGPGALDASETYKGRYVIGSYKHPKWEWEVVSEEGRKQTFKTRPDTPTGALGKTSVYCPAEAGSLPFMYGACKPLQ